MRKSANLFTALFVILGMMALATGLSIQHTEACGATCCGGQASFSIPDCDEAAGEHCECSCTCKHGGCACVPPALPGGGNPFQPQDPGGN